MGHDIVMSSNQAAQGVCHATERRDTEAQAVDVQLVLQEVAGSLLEKMSKPIVIVVADALQGLRACADRGSVHKRVDALVPAGNDHISRGVPRKGSIRHLDQDNVKTGSLSSMSLSRLRPQPLSRNHSRVIASQDLSK